MTKVQTGLFSSAIFAAALLGAFAITQAAYANVNQDGPRDGYKNHHSGIEISVSGHAMVWNEVETKADTGDNYAGGSVGGDGGNGGDIENEYGSQDVEGATTGNGGTGGNSGLGGLVQTGNATASANLMNDVNSSDIAVDNCGCEEATSSVDRIRIRTHDFAFLTNALRTKADTGDNRAKGSYAGDGGDGGEIENEGGLEEDNDDSDQEVDDSTTGSGGVGGNSSDGGVVTTGHADSRTDIVNLINSRLIRVNN